MCISSYTKVWGEVYTWTPFIPIFSHLTLYLLSNGNMERCGKLQPHPAEEKRQQNLEHPTVMYKCISVSGTHCSALTGRGAQPCVPPSAVCLSVPFSLTTEITVHIYTHKYIFVCVCASMCSNVHTHLNT